MQRQCDASSSKQKIRSTAARRSKCDDGKTNLINFKLCEQKKTSKYTHIRAAPIGKIVKVL